MDSLLVALYMTPLLILGLKIGTMFSVWGLVMAATKLVQALTRYINVRTANESTSSRR